MNLSDEPQASLAGALRVARLGYMTIPTGERHHASAIREGRISFEVFANATRPKRSKSA